MFLTVDGRQTSFLQAGQYDNQGFASGESGDIADAKGPSGQKPAWAAPRGTVSFHHGPGHAPGHVRSLTIPA